MQIPVPWARPGLGSCLSDNSQVKRMPPVFPDRAWRDRSPVPSTRGSLSCSHQVSDVIMFSVLLNHQMANIRVEEHLQGIRGSPVCFPLIKNWQKTKQGQAGPSEMPFLASVSCASKQPFRTGFLVSGSRVLWKTFSYWLPCLVLSGFLQAALLCGRRLDPVPRSALSWCYWRGPWQTSENAWCLLPPGTSAA